jgi:AAA+ ATPase superfamily predicted ATPase
MKQIGSLFPLGGPVAPDLVIGREGVIAYVEQRLREGLSTMLVGPRRIGKTTVCEAVCANLAEDHIVVRVEVPERAEPRELLQLIIDRCNTLSLLDDVKTAAAVVRPLIERLLGHENIPLDLSGLINAPAAELPVREVLRLPLELARERRHRGVLFLDELQRVMGYDGGEELLQDLSTSTAARRRSLSSWTAARSGPSSACSASPSTSASWSTASGSRTASPDPSGANH